MTKRSPLKPYWVDDLNEAGELAALFVENADVSYISHSELQLGLAETSTRWNSDILRLVNAGLKENINAEKGGNSHLLPSVFAARMDSELVATGLVSMHIEGQGVPYAILEDIVVCRHMRQVGIGRAVLEWVMDEVSKAGCQRLFLESGARNHRAHDFFQKHGFKQCSVVMMCELRASSSSE
ncbi:GNAT family N-acetyltransferase [Caballeronia sp. GAFFF1]|uniref:GNAT family N-acetyltransferase n=1 Tax=Caballeronia sp. GAFFF1 TaxID=2921779 RepID=UPI0020291F8E|nr:GNAT family N-acetyltransferase [Caballeronia sp. GAFFF1]